MYRLYHVNAFSHHPFAGNPAVVVLGEARPDAELQTLAAGAKFLLELASEEAVRALTPDFHALRALLGRGIMVTALSSRGEDDFVSRYFAPWVGVDEDPVTGSNHCALVPFWAERLGKRQLRARQVSARGGDLRLELQEERVLMAGRALTLWQGEWLLPPGVPADR